MYNIIHSTQPGIKFLDEDFSIYFYLSISHAYISLQDAAFCWHASAAFMLCSFLWRSTEPLWIGLAMILCKNRQMLSNEVKRENEKQITDEYNGFLFHSLLSISFGLNIAQHTTVNHK